MNSVETCRGATSRFLAWVKVIIDPEYFQDDFLSPEEERTIYKHYEFTLRDFCKKFQPPVPRSVIVSSGTTLYTSALQCENWNGLRIFHARTLLRLLINILLEIGSIVVPLSLIVSLLTS